MPYLRNAWYVGAIASEVTSAPLARTLLDEPVVLFRGDDGRAVALADRCPHRFVPLSRGRVQGCELVCGYHGLRFAADGACTDNPHGRKAIPSTAHVLAYPIVERYGFVWLWFGRPAAADPAALPAFPFLEDRTHYAVVYDRYPIAGNYQLVVDNLLDLGHVEFLHPLLAQREGIAAHRTEFLRDGDAVIANRWKPNALVHGLTKRYFWTSPSERADARSNMRWSPPSTLLFDLGATEVGAPVEEGVCIWNTHHITPETARSSHYFLALAYNRRIDDLGVHRDLQATLKRIITTEDTPMIELQQQAMGEETNLFALDPVMLEPDAPAIWARRTLAAKLAEEQRAPSVSALA